MYFPLCTSSTDKCVIATWFVPGAFDKYTYRYKTEPSYFFESSTIFALMLLINRLTPTVMKPTLLVFRRKQGKV